jgi:olfactory receptor
MGMSEFFLLTALSCDHYVAICKPLHYTTIMNRKICTLLVFISWLARFLTIFLPLMLILKLDFCASSVIDHFFCGYPHFTALMLRNMAVREDWILLCICYSVVTLA